MKIKKVTYELACLITGLFLISSCSSDPELSQEAQLEIDTEKIEAYITANNLQNVQTTASGLHYVVTELGTGNFPVSNELVSVHYEGTFLDGTKFDSSFDRETPITFTLGVNQVISGWDEGIKLMSEESKGILIIPSYLAYGTSGTGSIGANEVLVFDIEVLSDNQILSIDEAKIASYIVDNSFEDVERTDSGLQYVITQQGSGDLIETGNEVSVEYIGYYTNGIIFDQSGINPFDYTVGEFTLIAGWEEAIGLLNKGAKATFFLPSNLGYGKVGLRDNSGSIIIPSNQVLIFDLEVIDVN